MQAVSNFFSSITLTGNNHIEQERNIADLGKKEVHKRLNIRYPNRSIHENDIHLIGMKRFDFTDNSLGCPKPGYYYNAKKTPGYSLEFKYAGELFHLNTTKGKYFASNDLRCEEAYMENILKLAVKQLSLKLSQEIYPLDIVIDFYHKKQYTLENEIHYFFEFLYEGTTHSLCFIENGETNLLDYFLWKNS